jgi:L-fuculose-phosphate aldolase
MSLKEELAEYSRKVYERGFVAATDGNLSVRNPEGGIFITPSGVSKGKVTAGDILLVDYEGNKLEGSGKVSTEVKIHLLVYKHRKEVNAVIHTHPIYATAFASTGKGFTKPVFPEVALTLGKIPLCDFAVPSTEEVPDSMLPYVDYVWALLLANHGAVTFGKNLEDAFLKTEKLEHTAQILWVAESLGGAKSIPQEKLKKIYDISERVYGIKVDKRNRMDGEEKK